MQPNNHYHGKIQPEFFDRMTEEFRRYQEHKQAFDRRIIENNRWFKARYQAEQTGELPTPTTPYLFNAIANKHADAMDNFPSPNVLEREEKDREIAETFTRILPIQLDACNFRRTYSRAWWYKLKNGAACYGVFFNPELRGGLGEIDIRKIDLLNLFWEPGICDIQDSRFLFLTALIDREDLKNRYPQYADCFQEDGVSEIHTYDDMQNTNGADKNKDKLMVVDCYYKKKRGSHTTLELVKFCGNLILDATEDSSDSGLYAHGKYPFVLDVMYPDEDSPVGFGMVDIIKSPQLYIDRLDWIISRNAMISGKTRYMVKDNGGLNEYELTDCSKDIIHVAGNVGDENIRELQAKPLHSYIIQHRKNKIEEMKEIAGNRDFQQGGTTGGVTAYSAIAALQQAGEKLSRDMIGEGYNAFREIIYLCMELMRQFYDQPHSYRIDGLDGKREYLTFSNRLWKDQSQVRPLEFDVAVSAEKNNPYNRVAQNQTLTELWKIGVFRPDMAPSAKILLENMYFDGKEKLLEAIGSQQNLAVSEQPV
ncbi:MAG: hypothetical protein IJB80_05725 [Clostridia bacterium]|nr:hypothetical protein [Clostridia bacterium]